MKKKITILSIILLSFFLFCWYSLRPSFIRMSCSKKVEKLLEDNKNLAIEQFNNAYQHCLNGKGLRD